jgi:hypothetical protein
LNSTSWIRFAFNNLKPDLVNQVNITDFRNKTASTEKRAKRLTHKNGFMSALPANAQYYVEFEDALYPTNVSYDAGVYNVELNKYIIIEHKLFKKPDRVYIGNNLLNEKLLPLNASSSTGDWYWDNSTQGFTFILSNNQTAPFVDYDLTGFQVYSCRYVGCVPPTQPSDRLPVTSRPPSALFWSHVDTWSFLPVAALPQDGDSVLIPDGKYVVVDCALPKLKTLQIDGILEFDNGLNHTLQVDMIFINGGQLIIGWEKNPMLNNVEISLTGQKDSLDFTLPDGFSSVGGKGIGVFGGLDLHGRPRYPPWTQLAANSMAGSTTITLKQPVDWEPSILI